jgi:MFS family permease
MMTTATTLIADYYEGERRSAVMGQQAAFMGFGGVVFLVLGGVLADLSWRAPFGIISWRSSSCRGRRGI